MKHRTGEVHHVPRGVVGVISPWNFPLVIPMGTVIEALVTGNACVVKPSEVTPLVLLKAKEIYDSTGLPEDLFGVVLGFGATGQALIEAGIDYCVFTGAVETGRKVAAACGARLIPCTMELGGKAPLIACEDCDVERTARAIVFGGFANSGQVCISVERVYAHAARLRAAARPRGAPSPRSSVRATLRATTSTSGRSPSPSRSRSPSVTSRTRLKKGARLVRGGKRAPGPGQFFEPTVLADCDHSMTVMREEIFGPIVPFMRVKIRGRGGRPRQRLAPRASTRTSSPKGRATARRLSRAHPGRQRPRQRRPHELRARPRRPSAASSSPGSAASTASRRSATCATPKYVSFDRVPPPARDPIWFPYTARSYAWLQRGMRLFFGGGTLAKRIGEMF